MEILSVMFRINMERKFISICVGIVVLVLLCLVMVLGWVLGLLLRLVVKRSATKMCIYGIPKGEKLDGSTEFEIRVTRCTVGIMQNYLFALTRVQFPR